MRLNETAELMNSEDYKERFKGEYFQLIVRLNGLKAMIEKWDNGALTFTPSCPRSIYDIQLKAMGEYLMVLEKRAYIEGISLNG